MSAIKLNNALAHIKGLAISKAPDMVSSRVHIGPIEPTRVSSDPHIIIVQDNNVGERIDDEMMRRRVRLSIIVIMRLDPVREDPDFQINETYEPVHAALEAVRDGVQGKFETLVEVDDSLAYDTQVFKGVALRSAGADWDLTFDRTLGSTE